MMLPLPIWLKRYLACLLLALFSASASAAETKPTGLWHIIDNDSGQPEALLNIEQNAGTLRGTIVKVFPAPGEDTAPLCRLCEDELKDKPMIGLTILWNLKAEGKQHFSGKVLDPESGKIYRCQLTPQVNGKEMQLRVYAALFWEDRKLVRAN
jgi:uncharacterized protein (DUF2147 family)